LGYWTYPVLASIIFYGLRVGVKPLEVQNISGEHPFITFDLDCTLTAALINHLNAMMEGREECR
jgi:hypothetical protein